MYDHVVQEIFESFSSEGCLVAAFNARGAGKSGGHNASAQTETADFESVVAKLMSYAEDGSLAITKVYLCGYSYGSLIASLVAPPIPRTNYILISPLLTPVAGLTTFFTSSSQKTILSKHSADTQSPSVQGILAIYGGGDIFAFSTKRYRRFFEHVQRDWGTKAKIVEIEGGGHFWMDLRGKESLKREVMAFISS